MTSQYGAYTSRVGLARLYACMHMHTPHAPVPTWTHAQASMHTQTNMQYNGFVNTPQRYVIQGDSNMTGTDCV